MVEQAADSLRVVVADDHDLFRHNIVLLLDGESGIEIVAAAARGEDAVRAAVDHRADVVLMDLEMPGLSGIDATRRLTETAPHVAVVVLSMHEDDSSVVAAVQAGARGYVLKGAPRGELVRAIRAAAAGEAIFGPSVARRLAGWFSPTKEDPFPDLTARERDVLHLLAQGLANDRIAQRLFLSPKTVRNLVSAVFRKLKVHSRAEAIVRARAAGYGGVEGSGR